MPVKVTIIVEDMDYYDAPQAATSFTIPKWVHKTQDLTSLTICAQHILSNFARVYLKVMGVEHNRQ